MDTIHRENIAIGHIIAVLQNADILMARPYFDRAGADLLAFIDIGVGAKFCRVQSKLRTLNAADNKTEVTIPKDYVAGAFVAFVCITSAPDPGCPLIAYCFFVDEIEQWKCNEIKNKEGKGTGKFEYVLPLRFKTFSTDYKAFAFDTNRLERLKKTIREADVKREFGALLGGSAPVAQWKVVVETKHYIVRVSDGGTGRQTHIYDKRTKTVRDGPDCPGDPKDYQFVLSRNSWKRKSGK